MVLLRGRFGFVFWVIWFDQVWLSGMVSIGLFRLCDAWFGD